MMTAHFKEMMTRNKRYATKWGITALSLCLLLVALPAYAQEWKQLRSKHGLTLLCRKLAGERFPEYRIQTITPIPIAKLASYLMGRSIEEADPGMQRRIHERSRDFARWTDLIKTPVISDRCAASYARLKNNDGTGTVEIDFVSNSDWSHGKPTADCVPLRVHGSWSLQPTAEGTNLTYTIFADPGGNVPAFLVRGMIEDDALNRVVRVLSEAAQ